MSCVTSFGSAPSFAAPPLPASACLSTTNPTRSTSAHSIRPRQTLCIYTVRRSIVNSILLKNIFSQVHEKFDFSPRSHACARVVRHQTRRTRMHKNRLHQTRASRRYHGVGTCVRRRYMRARPDACPRVPRHAQDLSRVVNRSTTGFNGARERCKRCTIFTVRRSSVVRCDARACAARAVGRRAVVRD